MTTSLQEPTTNPEEPPTTNPPQLSQNPKPTAPGRESEDVRLGELERKLEQMQRSIEEASALIRRATQRAAR